MPNRINKASLLQIYTDFCPQTIKSDGYHHYIILLQNYTELCFPCSSKFGVCRYFLSPRLPNFARTRNVCYRTQPTKCSTLNISFIPLIQSIRHKSRKVWSIKLRMQQSTPARRPPCDHNQYIKKYDQSTSNLLLARIRKFRMFVD